MAPSPRRSLSASLSNALPIYFRAQVISEPVAEQAEGRGQSDDDQPRQGTDPGRAGQKTVALGDHHAPFGRGRLRPQSKESERAAQQDPQDEIRRGIDQRLD